MAVEDFFSAELGIPKYAEDELRYNCPFCSANNDYKLYLHIGEKRRGGNRLYGQWQCFKCGSRGNPAKFAMQLYGISYRDALDELEPYDYSPDQDWTSPSDLGLTDEEYLLLALRGEMNLDGEKEEQEMLVPPPLPAGFKLLADNTHNPEAYPFFMYAQRRGFPVAELFRHNAGYVIDSQVLLPSGKTLGLKNHMVFLTHDDNGQYIYWNTRAIGDSFVKTINAPSRDGEYSKRTVVFNLNTAKKTPCIVINEGVPDALTVGSSGVATFGKQVAEEQIKLILKGLTPEQNIYILLDNDAKDQIRQLAEKLYVSHRNTFIVVNPRGQDANDMGYEKTWELIKNNSVRADEQGILAFMLALY